MPIHTEIPADFVSKFTPKLVSDATVLLEEEEGFRAKPYLCSEGYPTVGYGQRIGAKNQPLSAYQFCLPKPVGQAWLTFNIELLIDAVATHPHGIASAFATCNLARQTILISMAYQLGVDGLAEFKNMLAAIKDERWQDAETHALDSLWAKQTPARAKRHARVLATGKMDAN